MSWCNQQLFKCCHNIQKFNWPIKQCLSLTWAATRLCSCQWWGHTASASKIVHVQSTDVRHRWFQECRTAAVQAPSPVQVTKAVQQLRQYSSTVSWMGQCSVCSSWMFRLWEWNLEMSIDAWTYLLWFCMLRSADQFSCHHYDPHCNGTAIS